MPSCHLILRCGCSTKAEFPLTSVVEKSTRASGGIHLGLVLARPSLVSSPRPLSGAEEGAVSRYLSLQPLRLPTKSKRRQMSPSPSGHQTGPASQGIRLSSRGANEGESQNEPTRVSRPGPKSVSQSALYADVSRTTILLCVDGRRVASSPLTKRSFFPSVRELLVTARYS